MQKIEMMEKKLFASPLHNDPRLPDLYAKYSKKQETQTRIRELKKRIQATNDVLQMEELKSRKRVLRRLGFTTAADIVDVKGRVACEISSGDELLLTELIFNGAFNSLTPEQCAGLLSCFVFSEKVGICGYLCHNQQADHLCMTERAGDEAQGRACCSPSCHARDRKENSQSIQGIETAY